MLSVQAIEEEIQQLPKSDLAISTASASMLQNTETKSEPSVSTIQTT